MSTVGCKDAVVNIYDSLYNDINEATKVKIGRVFTTTTLTYRVHRVQKQQSTKDCGLFAIAFATFFAVDGSSTTSQILQLDQSKLRSHLLTCLEKGHFTYFV